MKLLKMTCLIFIFLIISSTSFAEDIKKIKEIDRYIVKGAYETAIKEGLKYTKQYPESVQGWNVVGWAYVKNNQLDKALAAFDKVISYDKKFANAYVGMGVVYRKLKQLDQAKKSYQQAIAMKPKNAMAFSSLLVIELQQKNYAKAVEYGEKAWSLKKNNGSIAANLAIAYHLAGENAKRDKLYLEAKKLKYHNMAALDKRFGKK